MSEMTLEEKVSVLFKVVDELQDAVVTLRKVVNDMMGRDLARAEKELQEASSDNP